METPQFQDAPDRLRSTIDDMLDEMLIDELDNGDDEGGDGGIEEKDANMDRLKLAMLVRALLSRKRGRR